MMNLSINEVILIILEKVSLNLMEVNDIDNEVIFWIGGDYSTSWNIRSGELSIFYKKHQITKFDYLKTIDKEAYLNINELKYSLTKSLSVQDKSKINRMIESCINFENYEDALLIKNVLLINDLK